MEIKIIKTSIEINEGLYKNWLNGQENKKI